MRKLTGMARWLDLERTGSVAPVADPDDDLHRRDRPADALAAEQEALRLRDETGYHLSDGAGLPHRYPWP